MVPDFKDYVVENALSPSFYVRDPSFTSKAQPMAQSYMGAKSIGGQPPPS
jgi:hypothetical protein